MEGVDDPSDQLIAESIPDELMKLLLDNGERHSFQPSECLFDVGGYMLEFYATLDGEVEILDRSDNNSISFTIGSNQVLGKLGFLQQQAAVLACETKSIGDFVPMPIVRLRNPQRDQQRSQTITAH